MSKEDIKQVNRIAKEFGMSTDARRDFGKFLELEKANGYGGTKNKRGDFIAVTSYQLPV